MCISLTGCQKNDAGAESADGGDIDLNDSSVTIAVQPATTTESDAKAQYPNAKFIYVISDIDGIMQVTSGKADAYAIDVNYYEARRNTGKTDIRLHSDNVIGRAGLDAACASGKVDFVFSIIMSQRKNGANGFQCSVDKREDCNGGSR